MESEAKINRKRNPRETANPIAALFFVHMVPIFIRNYKSGVKTEDLYETLEEDKSSLLGCKLETTWRNEYKNHSKTALHRALVKLVPFELIISGVLKLFSEMMILVLPPYSIGKLVEHFSSTNSAVTKNEAYMHAVIIIITVIIDGLINHPVMMLLTHTSMKLRIACSSLIYRKSLRLSRTALAHTSVGQIVNLLSNDVSTFEKGFTICHFVWIAPLQTAVAAYLLYRQISVSAFAGMGFLLLFIPLQIYMGKRVSVLRLKTALRTDERVRFMNEILNGIQVIKMYTWEKPFAKLISYIRRLEIKSIRNSFFLEAIIISLEMFVTRTAIFISIIVFISLGNNLTPDTVYIITAIYNVIKPIITFVFSISIISLAEMNVSVCRIHKFMKYEEFQKPSQDDIITNNFLLDNKRLEKPLYVPAQIYLKDASAKWQSDNDDSTLSNINLTIDNNQLVAIIGSVGSGKSSLLNVFLRELHLCNGFLKVIGTISYAAQEPWLFSASIRQNILFGEQYDEDRYRAVIKVCALETDLDLLPFGDQTFVGDKGKSLSGGQKARINLARCVYKKADIYLLDDPLSAVDIKVGKQLYDQCIKEFLSPNICILITHQLQYIRRADKIIILDNGRIVGHGTYDSLQTSSSNFAVFLKKFNSEEENYVVSKNKTRSRQNSEVIDNNHEVNKEENQDKFEEVLEGGQIKFGTFTAYFRSGGNYFVLFSLLLAFIVNQCVAVGGDYFVTYWMNLEQVLSEERHNTSTPVDKIDRTPIIYTYSIIIVATIFFSVGHSILYFIFFMRASIKLHDSIFKNIMNGAMAFFNANPTGRILNRFSTDIGIIDEHIPFIFSDVVNNTLTLLGVLAVTSIVNPMLLAPSIIVIVLFYLIRIVCVETSRSAKRIEGITRSPIFNYVTASMHGLSTIRAFGAEETLIEEFDKNQDVHSSAWHLFISANGAFGFWLELISITLISLVIISLLALNNEYYGGEVGLIVTQYLGLMGMLQWSMRQWTEMENNMTSVERVLEYTKIETEPIRKMITNIPKIWPEYGRIVFQNVSMRYTANQTLVLNNLNFTINSCEKIGIVGRTGAGKTSMIAALFQLYDIDGSIIIDDIDVTKLPLEEVRPKISIIPQEPVLFSETIRKNLDPFEEYNDEVIWKALEQVELKDVIAEEPQKLNHIVSENGSNFSAGQRQLICLARAIIRNNKILVMDEATANVDPHTDSLIQKSIRMNFKNCTVITIAHRLHTIMDSDRVLVVDAGNVIEFDHPYNLLQKQNSLFYSIVQTTGRNESKNLFTIAKENFER